MRSGINHKRRNWAFENFPLKETFYGERKEQGAAMLRSGFYIYNA